jgi:transforming growth factor-beta-induced protein
MLTTGGPYLLFAPTDAAFAALPNDKRDALLADPKAFADLIRTHLVEGYFPYGTMGPIHEGFNRTVTNMRGEQLKMAGDDSALLINGKLIGETSGTFVANGTRVMSVPKLLLPEAK